MKTLWNNAGSLTFDRGVQSGTSLVQTAAVGRGFGLEDSKYVIKLLVSCLGHSIADFNYEWV